MKKRIILIFLTLIFSVSGINLKIFAESMITSMSNGNVVSNTFDRGIFSAESLGSGIFAIALYKNNELIQLSITESKKVEAIKQHMIVDDISGTTLKVFRLDSNGNPLCVNETLMPLEKNYRVYFNEKFDGNSKTYTPNNTTVQITDSGMLSVSGKNTRAWAMHVNHPDRYTIIEADYIIPDSVDFNNGYLLSGYSNSPVGFVYIRPSGIYAGWPGNKDNEKIYDSSLRSFNLACKLDMETFTFDVYINREKVNSKPLSLNGIIPDKYNSFMVFSAYLVADEDGNYLTSVLVDNYKAYSGPDFIDIGNDITTAHKTDFKTNPLWKTDKYERPESYEIAKKAISTGHPRVLLNSDDVTRIKNSKDERISEWKSNLIERADSYVLKEPYGYALSSTGSIENLSESISLMMDLGMAYLLTENTKYSDRAYVEAEVLFNVPYKTIGGTLISEEKRDAWNSSSYLDVAEISYIISLCYDWMYDAWSDDQKAELTNNILDKGLVRSYNSLMGYLNPTNKGVNDWYKSTNNWGAVCNGGVLMSAIAFMEQEPYICGTVAEATIRGLEYLLPKFAPNGAWLEGVGYWKYTLDYITALCATLDAACQSDYGISKSVGLKETQLYSLSLSGKTGSINYGDANLDRPNPSFMFYWANKYNDTSIGGAALYIKEEWGFKPNCYDLVYYNPDSVKENWEPPLSFYYGGTETVSFSSGNDKNDTYISISGGTGVATSHDHLDSGGIVLDMKGKRLFSDIGAEHYGAQGYFSANRYLYFRTRPESHNIFIIDPTNLKDSAGNVYYGQKSNAVSKITNYDKNNKIATMNLTEAYERNVSYAERTISLEGDYAVVTDNITLNSVADVYWNWYIKTGLSGEKIGCIEISEDGKSADVIIEDTEYSIEFETDSEYTLCVEDADYYVNVDPDINGTKHSNSDYQRLVLKIKNADETVVVKMVVK